MGVGMGRRLSMPERKWKVMCVSVCMFICMFSNACLIIASMLILAALCALLCIVFNVAVCLPLFLLKSYCWSCVCEYVNVVKRPHSSLEEQCSIVRMYPQVKGQGWGMRLSTSVPIWHLTFDLYICQCWLPGCCFFQIVGCTNLGNWCTACYIGYSQWTVPPFLWSPGSPGDKWKTWVWQ